MAAGQGFKTFVTGEVLTAGDVNGYLMQGINVFTNATARDAAILTPAEGQFAFTKDNNSLWYYDGAAWVASGATGDIEGVTAGVGISGGGTSGTVTVTNSMATAIDAKGDLVPGTGADTFARLAVGANGTILTADSAEATGLKWAAAAGGGKILQVVSADYSAETDNSTTTYADTGLTATITPTLSTSKILVMMSDTFGKNTQNVNNAVNVRIMRGATEILENKQLNYTGTADWAISQWAMSYVDSPATTSATTYKLQFKQWANNGPLVRAQNDGSKASIVLMEIGA